MRRLSLLSNCHWLTSVSLSWQSSEQNISFAIIKFKTFQDYLIKFKDFKALNLVQSNSNLFKAPYGPCYINPFTVVPL